MRGVFPDHLLQFLVAPARETHHLLLPRRGRVHRDRRPEPQGVVVFSPRIPEDERGVDTRAEREGHPCDSVARVRLFREEVDQHPLGTVHVLVDQDPDHGPPAHLPHHLLRGVELPDHPVPDPFPPLRDDPVPRRIRKRADDERHGSNERAVRVRGEFPVPEMPRERDHTQGPFLFAPPEMLETLDPDVLLDVRSVHLRDVDEFGHRRAHPRVAETDDPGGFLVPHSRESDPEVDPGDLPVLSVHGPDKEHRQFEQCGPDRQGERFRQAQDRPVRLFPHRPIPLPILSRRRLDRSSHPERNSTPTRSATTGNGTSAGSRTISFSVVTTGRPAAAARILSRSSAWYGWWSRNPRNRRTRKPDARRVSSNRSFCATPEKATIGCSPVGSGLSAPSRSTRARGARRVNAAVLPGGNGMPPIARLPCSRLSHRVTTRASANRAWSGSSRSGPNGRVRRFPSPRTASTRRRSASRRRERCWNPSSSRNASTSRTRRHSVPAANRDSPTSTGTPGRVDARRAGSSPTRSAAPAPNPLAGSPPAPREAQTTPLVFLPYPRLRIATLTPRPESHPARNCTCGVFPDPPTVRFPTLTTGRGREKDRRIPAR